jgi:hypothetical protein
MDMSAVCIDVPGILVMQLCEFGEVVQASFGVAVLEYYYKAFRINQGFPWCGVGLERTFSLYCFTLRLFFYSVVKKSSGQIRQSSPILSAFLATPYHTFF